MTTAHRPTYTAAMGHGTSCSGNAFVAQSTKVANRDASSFLSLKTRQPGQGAPEERGSRKALREDLERREKKAKDEQDGKMPDKKDEKKGPVAIEDNPFPEDADDAAAPSDSEKSDKPAGEDDDDDDDEDTEELMRELAKIKEERQAEEELQNEQKRKQDERSRRDEVMRGNPLLQAASDMSLKRKWDDDTVFKNQAKTAPKAKVRFINDAVRSDFHRKFLNKYVWVDGQAH
mmetsp:Transcript_14649/g.42684  ORF Transcript_14649/g.42684 Transcript_14649/m.42684 type:complete len:232 (+) Transcript_14649:50-745(+)|eukprot:CAMPEP_0168390366 /NCGR_PEP_ID=MMETSP0228-20121227/17437_1 /TAXON_ID=133427 /ORGANISM="Protoceratium reticulatum, Strain CCCM 535 (=CCMP 1889)" /LENGTH=231 /DNA_ID=CAMNT_0008403657 /DNA_START=18 /DNA_END=713 /DNA_ORIENTATION=-